MEFPKKMLRFRGDCQDIPPDIAFARNRMEESELREEGFQPWMGSEAKRMLEAATAEWEAEWEEIRELERMHKHG